MTARVKAKTAPPLPVPQDDAAATAAVREIGELRRDIARLEADMNDQIAQLQQRYGEQVRPLRDTLAERVEGLKTYAQANRARLCGKGKSHRFATGVIAFRTRPPKVTLRKVDAVIEAIRNAGLTHFLRTKVEVNKDAMLDEPEAATAIAGVKIGSAGEDFIVEPDETRLGGAA